MALASGLIDVAIVGAGPAGLAAATALARQVHTAVVFDAGIYRNHLTQHMHNVPTWDHQDPAKFRAASRAELERRYETINFQDVAVTSVEKTDTGTFSVLDAWGTSWTARKLILAVGITDVLPEVEGYSDCWANGIYHCLFCHGFEERGVPSAGVLAIEPMANENAAVHLARMSRRLTEKVTIYTNGNDALKEKISPMVDGINIVVDSRPIQRLEKGPHASDVILHLQNPSEIRTEGFLAHGPRFKINSPVAEQLSLETEPSGEIKVKPPFYETSVPGVFAAGDIATPLKTVIQALAMGSFAGAGAAFQVQAQLYQ